MSRLTALSNNTRNVENCCTSNFRQFYTDGDKDLVEYLNEEISYEEESAKRVQPLKNFNTSMDGTLVTLKRTLKGENIEVVFNCNDSINVDTSDRMGILENEGDEEEYPEDHDFDEILSYPTFTVTITKPSGTSLLFKCNCRPGMSEEDDDMDMDMDDESHDEDGKDTELLRIESVQVYNSESDVDQSKIYEAEVENMDGELYSMLLDTLLERGIDGAFVNELIGLSTNVEHQHYLAFLRLLKNFANER